MFVVRKDDGKLKSVRRIAKRKPSLITWRDFRVTHGTNRWPVSPEKLRSMATYTRNVIRVVSYVGMRFSLLPAFAWNLVTGVALRLMFLR